MQERPNSIRPSNGKRFRVLIALIAVVLFVLGFANPAQGRIQESDGAIVDRTTQQTIDMLPSRHIGLPASLSTGSVYVIITQGAAFIDVRVIGDSSIPPERLAHALDAAVASTPLAKKPIEYSSDGNYSAALATFSSGRMGLDSSSTALSVAPLVKGIQKAGFGIVGVLKVPRYASVSGTPAAYGHSRLYYWYNTQNIGRPPVVVQARLTRYEECETAIFPFFVPVVTLLGILSAVLIARSPKIPIALRRRLYLKLMWYPCFVAIGLHILFTLYYLQSPVGRMAADLWLGTMQLAGAFGPFLMIGPACLIVVVPFTSRLEKRLYGRDGAAAPVIEYTPEEQSAKKAISRWMWLPLIFCVAILTAAFFIPAREHRLWLLVQPAALGLIFASTFLLRRLLRKHYSTLDNQTSDPELTARAERIAEKLGTKLGEIKINDGPAARQYASAMALTRGRVRVSRKLVEELTGDELDFILAHEIAHIERRDIIRTLATMLVGFLFMSTPMLIISGKLTLPSSLWSRELVLAVPFLGLAILFIGFSFLRRQREYAADRDALKATGNLAAAESALDKITQHSAMPYLHDSGDLLTHPKLSKRIAALRRIATELGLEEPAVLTEAPADLAGTGSAL